MQEGLKAIIAGFGCKPPYARLSAAAVGGHHRRRAKAKSRNRSLIARGTGSSNPFPSSVESGANSTTRLRPASCEPRARTADSRFGTGDFTRRRRKRAGRGRFAEWLGQRVRIWRPPPGSPLRTGPLRIGRLEGDKPVSDPRYIYLPGVRSCDLTAGSACTAGRSCTCRGGSDPTDRRRHAVPADRQAGAGKFLRRQRRPGSLRSWQAKRISRWAMGAKVAPPPNKPRQDKSIAGVASFTPLCVSDKIEGESSWVNFRARSRWSLVRAEYRPGTCCISPVRARMSSSMHAPTSRSRRGRPRSPGVRC